MNNDLDIDSELDEVLGNKVEVEFQWYYVNISKIKENINFRWIPDFSGIPCKTLHNIREGSILDFESGDKYRIRLCDKSDFINLSSSQVKLIDDLNEELDAYCNRHPDEWKFKPTKSTTLFFGTLFDIGDIKYTKYKTSLFLSTSVNFLKYFKQFYKDSLIINGNEWANKVFNRDPKSNYAISLNSERIDYGYKFNFDFIEYPEVDLCQEVFDRANNLNEEYIDVINFNEELYSEFLSKIIKINKDESKVLETLSSEDLPF